MDVLTSETCWAIYNKASVILLVNLYSNIKMMHSPIRIRCISIHLNLHTLWQQNEKTKDLDQMVAGISATYSALILFMHTSLILLVLFPTVCILSYFQRIYHLHILSWNAMSYSKLIKLKLSHHFWRGTPPPPPQKKQRNDSCTIYITQHDILHTHYLDEIPLDHIHRARRLYACSKQIYTAASVYLKRLSII